MACSDAAGIRGGGEIRVGQHGRAWPDEQGPKRLGGSNTLVGYIGHAGRGQELSWAVGSWLSMCWAVDC